MRLSLLIIVCNILLHSTAWSQPSTIVGHTPRRSVVFEDQDFSGTTSDTSKWYRVDPYHFFGIGFDINTDSTFFIDAIDDSLNAEVKYELSFDDSPSDPYYKDGDNAPLTILTVTIADTAGAGAIYQSFHNGTADISPSSHIRFIVTKSAGHVLGDRHIVYTLTFLRQP